MVSKGKRFFLGLFVFSNSFGFGQVSIPSGSPVGEVRCRVWQNSHWVDVPCPGSGGNNITEKVPSGPTKRQLRIAEYNERIDKANELMRQANNAALANNAEEALRLAKAAQEMAKDFQWLKEWIMQLEDHIKKEKVRKTANDLRKKYYEAGKQYNLKAAYSFLKQAWRTDPLSFTPDEKDWIGFIEEQLKKDPKYLETNDSAKDYLSDVLKNFDKVIDTSSLSEGLTFTASIDSVLNKTSVEEDDEPEIIKSINRAAKKSGWSLEEQKRLKIALDSLENVEDENLSRHEMRKRAEKIWKTINDRIVTDDIKAKAKLAKGMGLPGAGQQSFEDCAVFALANAAGLPYGIVAARAAKLISEAEWRSSAHRSNPQQAIKDEGLNGGEVLFLAEAFGQVEIIRSDDFSKAVKEGRPVMINIWPGHQVVLNKTFEHDGKIWFEMIDSNLQGPWQRRYLNLEEVKKIILEKGIAFKPEQNTEPKLLR
jgi:hypothetical protein